MVKSDVCTMSLYTKLLIFYICIQRERGKRERETLITIMPFSFITFFNFKEKRVSCKIKILYT